PAARAGRNRPPGPHAAHRSRRPGGPLRARAPPVARRDEVARGDAAAGADALPAASLRGRAALVVRLRVAMGEPHDLRPRRVAADAPGRAARRARGPGSRRGRRAPGPRARLTLSIA